MKRNSIIVVVATAITIALIVESCVSTKVAEKSGNQLWSENCQRCHNTPPSSAFTNSEWGLLNMHMRVRAMLTEDEYKKILAFMQGE